MLKLTYWNNKGLYQTCAEQLNELIPFEGSVPNPRSTNKHLERFRKASNCYHDLYNNGLDNRMQEFRNVFNIAASNYVYRRHMIVGRRRVTRKIFGQTLYVAVEHRMNELVFAAAKEQGFVTAADTYPEALEELA